MHRHRFHTRIVCLGILLSMITIGIPEVRAQSSPADTTGYVPPPRRPWVALGEGVLLNTMLWSFNRYLRDGGENPGFRIGFNSWEENFKNGFEWDDNNFKTNQL